MIASAILVHLDSVTWMAPRSKNAERRAPSIGAEISINIGNKSGLTNAQARSAILSMGLPLSESCSSWSSKIRTWWTLLSFGTATFLIINPSWMQAFYDARIYGVDATYNFSITSRHFFYYLPMLGFSHRTIFDSWGTRFSYSSTVTSQTFVHWPVTA